MITGGDMETPIAAEHRLFQACPIADIPFDAFVIDACQAARIASGSEQAFDTMAARDQFVDQVCSDKAGSPGDKAFHQHAILNFRGWSSNEIDLWVESRTK
jgi:hypothetical protein